MTVEEGEVCGFPLVQLPKKFKGLCGRERMTTLEFPLVQLPKKFKGVRRSLHRLQTRWCFH